jgi:hypothetical protein
MLTEDETAEMIGMSAGFLQMARYRGFGPVHHKLGRAIRYSRRDVVAWLESRRVVAESHEPVTKRGAKR